MPAECCNPSHLPRVVFEIQAQGLQTDNERVQNAVLAQQTTKVVTGATDDTKDMSDAVDCVKYECAICLPAGFIKICTHNVQKPNQHLQQTQVAGRH